MTTIPMKLSPWLTPNFAVIDQKPGKREYGFKTSTSIPVEELPQEALDEMAAQWISDLYQKAGKPSAWANDCPAPQEGE